MLPQTGSAAHYYPSILNHHTSAMAYPPTYREVAPPLPSIKIHAGDRFSAHHDMPFGRASAMPIPGIEPRHHVPPALPPPPEPFTETPRRAEDLKRERRGYASNHGSINSSYADERPSLKRRDTGGTTGDEGYASYASTDRYALETMQLLLLPLDTCTN